jgi:hypothetical protein
MMVASLLEAVRDVASGDRTVRQGLLQETSCGVVSVVIKGVLHLTNAFPGHSGGRSSELLYQQMLDDGICSRVKGSGFAYVYSHHHLQDPAEPVALTDGAF